MNVDKRKANRHFHLGNILAPRHTTKQHNDT
jgi:hypothetical protein